MDGVRDWDWDEEWDEKWVHMGSGTLIGIGMRTGFAWGQRLGLELELGWDEEWGWMEMGWDGMRSGAARGQGLGLGLG